MKTLKVIFQNGKPIKITVKTESMEYFFENGKLWKMELIDIEDIPKITRNKTTQTTQR